MAVVVLVNFLALAVKVRRRKVLTVRPVQLRQAVQEGLTLPVAKTAEVVVILAWKVTQPPWPAVGRRELRSMATAS